MRSMHDNDKYLANSYEKKRKFGGLTAGVIILVFANTTAAGAEWCTAALQNIQNSFPNVPYSVISLVLNIPNLCAAVLSIVSGIIVDRKISLKKLMLIAIAFHCIGGVMPAFFGENSIGMLLFGRFVFGIGYGLMTIITVRSYRNMEAK